MTLLLIGLGNPGIKYSGTRHNTGFDVIDKLASKLGVKLRKSFFKSYHIAQKKIDNYKLVLIKPTTFMNRSGEILPDLLRKYKISNNNIIVIVDNMDINPGALKFKQRGSDGGHNGLKSINEWLGTTEYKRLFIGIGRPEKGSSIPDYVLAKISEDSVFTAEDRAVDGLLKLPLENIDQITNFLNRKTN